MAVCFSQGGTPPLVYSEMKKIQVGGHRGGRLIREYALVDDEDFEWLNQWKWYAHKGTAPGLLYVVRKISMNGKRIRVFMHRAVLDLKKGEICDHKNRNGLDNRRKNLRRCTHAQNSANCRSHLGATSQYRGVYWHKTGRRWVAQAASKGKIYYLGCFKDEKEAALAYNKMAESIHGEFANLNKIQITPRVSAQKPCYTDYRRQ